MKMEFTQMNDHPQVQLVGVGVGKDSIIGPHPTGSLLNSPATRGQSIAGSVKVASASTAAADTTARIERIEIILIRVFSILCFRSF